MIEQATGNRRTAIVMVGHGEPEVFDADLWSRGLRDMFNELRRTGVEAPPETAIPMILSEIRHKYQAIGGRSRHAEICRQQGRLVGEAMPGTPVGLGFNEFIAPHFPDIAEEFIADGVTGLVFVPMMLTDSSHTQEISEKIKALDLEKRGIQWVLSKPLFYRPEPTLLVIEKILAAAGSGALDRAGVILCCHGEPEAWVQASRVNTRCNEQETAFCYAVKKGLVERGFSWDNIVRGFNEFTTPGLSEAVQILTKGKAKKMIAVATFGTTDCLHVNYDIPTRIRVALDCSDIELVCLGGWNEDPLLIKAYAALARDAMQRI